jgi:hypothetical protein
MGWGDHLQIGRHDGTYLHGGPAEGDASGFALRGEGRGRGASWCGLGAMREGENISPRICRLGFGHTWKESLVRTGTER